MVIILVCGGRYRSTRRFGPGSVKMVGSAALFFECVHSGMPLRSDATGKTQRLPTILPERLTLGTAYRHPMISGSIQGPGRQLARGCLVGESGEGDAHGGRVACRLPGHLGCALLCSSELHCMHSHLPQGRMAGHTWPKACTAPPLWEVHALGL